MIKYFDYKEAKKLIALYKEKGFDIRFIGGTSFDGTINSIGLIPSLDKKGRLYFLVIPYNIKVGLLDNKDEHFDYKKENPKVLMIRKIKDESNLKVHTMDLESLIKVIVSDNRPDFRGRKHTKFFYLIKSFSGELLNRDHDIFSDMKTLTPFFIPAALVPKEIFGGHLDAYIIALRKMYRRVSYYDFGLSMNAYYRRKKSIKLEYQKHKKKNNIAPSLRK